MAGEIRIDEFRREDVSSSIARASQRLLQCSDNRTKYLVGLPHRAEAGAAHTSSDGLPPHLIRVHLRDVVKLALERFASSVLARTGDLAHAGSVVQDPLQILVAELWKWGD
jgi:hypothetical protein